MIGIIGVLYTEPDPKTYRGVALRMPRPGSPQEVFNTGDPTVDYNTAGAVFHFRMGSEAISVGTSSVDHFIMDGGDLETEDPTQEQIDAALTAAKAYLISKGELVIKADS